MVVPETAPQAVLPMPDMPITDMPITDVPATDGPVEARSEATAMAVEAGMGEENYSPSAPVKCCSAKPP